MYRNMCTPLPLEKSRGFTMLRVSFKSFSAHLATQPMSLLVHTFLHPVLQDFNPFITLWQTFYKT